MPKALATPDLPPDVTPDVTPGPAPSPAPAGLGHARRHERITVAHHTFVLVPEEEYRANAGLTPLPPLPPADADGNRPAVDFCRANIARTIIRRREAAGLTQRELAAAAGVTPAVLCRVERGRTTPTLNTVVRIDNALTRAGAPDPAAAG